MSTDLRNSEKRRGASGQFAKGNPGGPGRPKGMLNSTTIDAREICRRAVDSWDRVDADAKLDDLAGRDFVSYLRFLSGLLPKNELPQTAEWWEQTRAELEGYVSARVRKATAETLVMMAAMTPTEREEVFERVVEDVDNSDLTEQDGRDLVSDVIQSVADAE